jgi:hypothetical protein
VHCIITVYFLQLILRKPQLTLFVGISYWSSLKSLCPWYEAVTCNTNAVVTPKRSFVSCEICVRSFYSRTLFVVPASRPLTLAHHNVALLAVEKFQMGALVSHIAPHARNMTDLLQFQHWI